MIVVLEHCSNSNSVNRINITDAFLEFTSLREIFHGIVKFQKRPKFMRLANARSRFIFKQKQNHYSAFPSWDTRLTRFEQVAAVVAAETDAKLSDFVPRPSRGNLRACCSKGLGELVEGVTAFQAVSSSHFSKLLN